MASETIANGTTEIVHRLDLNEYGLDEVPEEDRKRAKTKVANYLENQVLREVNAGKSPVKGEGRFKRLESDYAVKVKGGTRLANLEHEGDLLNSFKVTLDEGSFLEAGHKGSQTPKADGHNQLSSKARAWALESGFPRRRYIPDDNQKYTSTITDEIISIIDRFIPDEETVRRETRRVDIVPEPVERIETLDETTVTLDLFSDDVIESLLEQAIRARNGF